MTPQGLLALDGLIPFVLVFARILAAFVILPAFGDHVIPMRVRILCAFMIAGVIMPTLSSTPLSPAGSPWFFALCIFQESLIGLFIGLCVRTLFSALDLAGFIMGFQSGLTNVFVTNPGSGASGALPGALMNAVAATLLFATDAHHGIIHVLADSYEIYKPGDFSTFFGAHQDFLMALFQIFILAFTLGIQLATPFIVLGLVYFIALGALNRLMPQLPVFFISQPLQVALGLLLIMLVFSSTMDHFMQHFRDLLLGFWEARPTDFLSANEGGA